TGRVEFLHDFVLPFVEFRVAVVGFGAGDAERIVLVPFDGYRTRFEENHSQWLAVVAEQGERRFFGASFEGEFTVRHGRFGNVFALVVHQGYGTGEPRYVAGDGVAVL